MKIYLVMGVVTYEFSTVLKAYTTKANAVKCRVKFKKMTDRKQWETFDMAYDKFEVNEIELDE